MRIAGAGRIVASVGRIGQGALEQSAPKKSEDSASQHQSPCFHFSRSIPLPLPLSPSPSPSPLLSSRRRRRRRLLVHTVEPISADFTSSRRPECPRLDISSAIYFRSRRCEIHAIEEELNTQESRVSWRSDTPRATM